MRKIVIAVTCIVFVGSLSYADGGRVPSHVIDALSHLDTNDRSIRRGGTQTEGTGGFRVVVQTADGTSTTTKDGATTTDDSTLEPSGPCEHCGMEEGVDGDGNCSVCGLDYDDSTSEESVCEHCGMNSDVDQDGSCTICGLDRSGGTTTTDDSTPEPSGPCENCGMEDDVDEDGNCSVCGLDYDDSISEESVCEHCGMNSDVEQDGSCTICGEDRSGDTDPEHVESSYDHYDPAEAPETFSGPSGSSTSSDVEIFIENTGGSTGSVFVAYFVNNGKKPVVIETDGAVIEPVENPDPATVARMDEIRAAMSSGKTTWGGPMAPYAPSSWLYGTSVPVSVVRLADGPTAFDLSGLYETPPPSNMARIQLDGYCLDKELEPPTEGMLFRIVSVEEQRSRGSFRAVLRASDALRETGRLRPDSDAEEYFHSIRQWAIWVEEEELTREDFEAAFLQHVREGIEGAGHSWSEKTEETVRSFVPNRWNDVTAILIEAGLTSATSTSSSPTPTEPMTGATTTPRGMLPGRGVQVGRSFVRGPKSSRRSDGE